MDVRSGVVLQVPHLSAWASDRVDDAAWRSWAAGQPTDSGDASPDVRHVDAMLRRRLSPLSRMLVSVCHRALSVQPVAALVFASRHGELRTTVPLIQQLLRAEPLSPMGFALSVHNTAAGLHAMAAQDTCPSLTLAAGRDSLSAGLLEAAMQARTMGAPVLLAYAEEPPPPPYAAEGDSPTPLAFAAVLAPAGRRLRLVACDSDPERIQPSSPGLAFLQAWYGGGAARWAGERSVWILEQA